jgi:hypothetical protein
MRLLPYELAKSAVRLATTRLDVEVVRRRRHDWSDTRKFIPLHETVDAAEQAGLSVGDYIDNIMSKTPGATQATIDGMKQLGVFSQQVQTIVEIGPGSGRYLEKTVAACSPRRYEVYETAGPWASYIESKYDVLLQPTDGRSLKATPDSSADLVHAHKVFSSIPSLPTWMYWTEMSRVCRKAGYVVFDILTEACLDTAILRHWVNSGIENGAYPAAMPRTLALDYFESCGFDNVGTFLVPMGLGSTTEVFVFRGR